tara:strand:- start:373 stop:2658 length:2286 start_codon:yes stop_codon:yes gene_type:complete
MQYDYSKLNDREFELLGASIITKILNQRVETFKPGRDEGVDGRFWLGKNREGILQCKHYTKTPLSRLFSKLKNEEAIKVTKLNPSRYILITSKELSRHDKQKIKKIFDPFIICESDIFGKEDLNDFLSNKNNQDVVEQNFKLWITSASVLDIIYNNAIKGRSECTIRDIEENAHKYAITENHKRGIEILEKGNVIILTGEPGIGKTTLADNLSLYYTIKGYDFYDIENNISEAESIFRQSEKKKILFYCDDFLGSHLYDAINNKKDSHIVKFIKRVSKDNSKKFILTSRTNILNKAYRLSHKFQNERIRDNEFLLKIENLTEIDKAQILYNHIYHSSLDSNYIDEIYTNRRYKQIINHRNFNPRIIEFVTDSFRVGNITSDNYWRYITKNLEVPEDIWADYFQNQTDDSVRSLVYLTVFNHGKIFENKLRKSYNEFIKIHPINLGDQSDKSFEAVRKLGIKSLLNRNQILKNSYEYELFNPSIADFIINSYSQETDLIANVLKSLESEDSLRYIKTLCSNRKISISCLDKIQNELFNHFLRKSFKKYKWDFLILLIYLNVNNLELKEYIRKILLELVASNNSGGSNLTELLFIIEEFEPEIEIENYFFLYGFLNSFIDEDTLKALMNFVEKYDVNDSHILSIIEDYLNENIDEMINRNDIDIDFKAHINQIYYPDGTPDIDIDINSITQEIQDKIEYYLLEFSETVLNKIGLNVSDIVSNQDIDYMAISYLERYQDYDISQNEDYSASYSNEGDIDAIFER